MTQDFGGDPAALLERAAKHRPLSEALFLALRDDPFYAKLEQHAVAPDGPRAAMLRYYDYSLFEAAEYGRLLAVGTMGAAAWALPLSPERAAQKSRAKRQTLDAAMGPASRQAWETMGAGMSRNSANVTDPSDWYLSILGLHPDRQGGGLGPRLVLPVLEEADSAGVATYLETFTPRNESFYGRLGFRPAGRFLEEITGSEYCLMRREPFGS